MIKKIKLKISTKNGTWKVQTKTTPKCIIAEVFRLIDHDLRYMPKATLINNANEMYGLVIDCLVNQNRKTNKIKKQKEGTLEKFEKLDRDSVIACLYNEVLRTDGLSTLHGFKLADSNSNPETRRISKKHFDTDEEINITFTPLRRTNVAKKITKKMKVSVAKELNLILGLDPALDIKAKDLDAKIEEAAGLIDLDEDAEEFTDKGKETLELMGLWPSDDDTEEEEYDVDTEEDEEEPEPVKAKKKPAKKQAVEEPEDEDDEAKLIRLMKTTKKLADLKEVCGEFDEFADIDTDDFKGLAGPRELKKVMLEALDDEIQEKIAAKTKKPASPNASPNASPLSNRMTAEEIKVRNGLIERLIGAGKHTRKEIAAKVLVEFPEMNPSTLATMLCDSKNPKYSKFPKVAQEDENKIMSFID